MLFILLGLIQTIFRNSHTLTLNLILEGAWVSLTAPNVCSNEKGKGKVYRESSCPEWQGENPTADMGGAERSKVTKSYNMGNGDMSNMAAHGG